MLGSTRSWVVYVCVYVGEYSVMGCICVCVCWGVLGHGLYMCACMLGSTRSWVVYVCVYVGEYSVMGCFCEYKIPHLFSCFRKLYLALHLQQSLCGLTPPPPFNFSSHKSLIGLILEMDQIYASRWYIDLHFLSHLLPRIFHSYSRLNWSLLTYPVSIINILCILFQSILFWL